MFSKYIRVTTSITIPISVAALCHTFLLPAFQLILPSLHKACPHRSGWTREEISPFFTDIALDSKARNKLLRYVRPAATTKGLVNMSKVKI